MKNNCKNRKYEKSFFDFLVFISIKIYDVLGLTDTCLATHIMSSEPVKQMSLAMHAIGRFGSISDCTSVVHLLLDSLIVWDVHEHQGVDV